MNAEEVFVGKNVEVIPVSLLSDGKGWVAECPSLPEWSCTLICRHSSEIAPSTPTSSWILNIERESHHLELTDSDFGFLPISDRMRSRYVESLLKVNAVVVGKAPRTADADYFSEVKGMFSRSARRDQWDWCEVYRALDQPSFGLARKFSRMLGEMSNALRKGSANDISSALKDLRSSRIHIILSKAHKCISSSMPGIPDGRTLTGKKTREPSRDSEKTGRSVLSEYSKNKLDVANAKHSEILSVLVRYLTSHGHDVEENQFIDAFTRLKSGPALFEAKSIRDENEISQIRRGLSQLYEYRFRHDIGDASLWLLLSQKPKEKWLIEYLERDRDIRVLWVEDNQISGPSLEKLLESGSASLRRVRS